LQETIKNLSINSYSTDYSQFKNAYLNLIDEIVDSVSDNAGFEQIILNILSGNILPMAYNMTNKNDSYITNVLSMVSNIKNNNLSSIPMDITNILVKIGALNSLSPLESKIIALLKVILNCLFSSVK
jgi:hypothetical protein